MPWGNEPTNGIDLGEVAQPISVFFVRRLRRRDTGGHDNPTSSSLALGWRGASFVWPLRGHTLICV